MYDTQRQRPTQSGSMSTGAALAMAAEALDSIDHAGRAVASDRERLGWVKEASTHFRRAEALFKKLVAEADDAGSSMRLHGTPTTSWLTLDGQTSAKEAAGLLFAGRDLGRYPLAQKKALAGEIGMGQARAIGQAMAQLPSTLTPGQVAAAEEKLVERAADTPSDKLRKAAPVVLDEVRPYRSEQDRREWEQQLLEEKQRRARRRRSLWFWNDDDGSVLFKGSLPVLEAEPLQRLIASYVESDRRRGRDQRDPRAEARTGEQRRADALLELVAAAQTGNGSPSMAGDRPRVVVLMDEDSLRQRAEQAGRLGSGERITAGELRRLVCDAELTPVVLGSDSEVLDAGRDKRLVTPQIRRTLSARDGGCQFPGCDVRDERCEAHHIIPWWAGGATALENLVSLCPHHHHLVEPARFWRSQGSDEWQVRLDGSGRAVFIPPSRQDPKREPIPGNRTQLRTAAWSHEGRAGPPRARSA